MPKPGAGSRGLQLDTGGFAEERAMTSAEAAASEAPVQPGASSASRVTRNDESQITLSVHLHMSITLLSLLALSVYAHKNCLLINSFPRPRSQQCPVALSALVAACLSFWPPAVTVSRLRSL